MNSISSITQRLEAYLEHLGNVNKRWMAWIAESESAVLRQDIQHLVALTPSADQFVAELQDVVAARTELLDDAGRAGFVASDLQSLARCLPAWHQSSLRDSIRSAKQQLDILRRLHAAAWVLINESLQFYQGTMTLLVAGKSGNPVYVQTPGADTGGGQLLDANL